jgi:hypothetical protein
MFKMLELILAGTFLFGLLKDNGGGQGWGFITLAKVIPCFSFTKFLYGFFEFP